MGTNKEPRQELAEHVDVSRYMGTWYVHGHTPTFMDKEAYAATETYEMQEDGRIETTYRYLKGGFDGKAKTYHPVGRVHDKETGAEWRMRFFWVINAPYYILYVDPNYEYTVVGHPNRSMAWIMSRSPKIEEDRYQSLRRELERRDYDLSDFRHVPQQDSVAPE